jgi:hypothetical protein
VSPSRLAPCLATSRVLARYMFKDDDPPALISIARRFSSASLDCSCTREAAEFSETAISDLTPVNKFLGFPAKIAPERIRLSGYDHVRSTLLKPATAGLPYGGHHGAETFCGKERFCGPHSDIFNRTASLSATGYTPFYACGRDVGKSAPRQHEQAHARSSAKLPAVVFLVGNLASQRYASAPWAS